MRVCRGVADVSSQRTRFAGSTIIGSGRPTQAARRSCAHPRGRSRRFATPHGAQHQKAPRMLTVSASCLIILSSMLHWCQDPHEVLADLALLRLCNSRSAVGSTFSVDRSSGVIHTLLSRKPAGLVALRDDTTGDGKLVGRSSFHGPGFGTVGKVSSGRRREPDLPGSTRRRPR